MSETRQFCTFRLDDHFVGVEVELVQEVIRYQEMTPVPLAAPAVSGLINLRGQIVTAVDLRTCLGMPARSSGKLPMNVVVRASDRVVSLLVDEIGDVLDVDSDSFEKPPSTVDKIDRALFTGVYKLEDRLLLVLDTERAVAWGITPGAAEAASRGTARANERGGS
jgi:purine-binding chemotaxis protein CheW